MARTSAFSACALDHLQSPHRAGTGGEFVGCDAEPLQDGDEKVRQRIVALAVNAGIEPPPDDSTQASRSHTGLMRGTLRAVGEHDLFGLRDPLYFRRQVAQD